MSATIWLGSLGYPGLTGSSSCLQMNFRLIQVPFRLLPRQWTVHKEDHVICERLQLGRASPVVEIGGALSQHWEDCVQAF